MGASVLARETYDGFGTVNVHVRPLDTEKLAARDQLRNPTRPLSWFDRVLLRWDAWVMPKLVMNRQVVSQRLLARGHRKPSSLASG